MGPRLNSRGIPATEALRALAAPGFNGAAAEQPRNLAIVFCATSVSDQLQWGRG